MIDRLAQLVAIRSISGEEGPLADHVCADLERHGLAVRRQGHNVWCELGDAPRPRLLLNSHLDTVPPGNGWTGDPWTPRTSDGRITGLGANDAKGCVMALIEACLAIQRRLDHGEPLGGTIVLALTAEEETSGQGLGTILEQLAPLDAAIVGEPTSLVPMTAQRGLLIVRGVAHGRSSHPANTPPELAENAITAALQDLARLETFDWGPAHALLGGCHGNVTMIRGGLARNVIPDTCEFFLDIRTTPAEPHAALLRRLRECLCSELHIHSDRLVPVETNVSEPIVQAALQAAPGTCPAGSPAMSDMVFLSGIPSIKIGPGDSRRSHTPDEFVTAEELQDGKATYEQIVQAYFETVAAGVHSHSVATPAQGGGQS